MSGAMGPVPITWQELDAWQRQTGMRLQPWEARAVISLSRAYAGEAVAAREDDAPAPYGGGIGDGQRLLVHQQLQTELRAMVAAQNERKSQKRKQKRAR